MTDRKNPSLNEEDLLRQICAGDDAAFDSLIERYMPMLRSEALRIQVHGVDTDDLVQEASLGLLSAAKAYRSDGGASFSTFARVCVRRRLLNAARVLAASELPQDDPSLFDEIDNDVFTSRLDPDEWLLHKEDEAALLDRLKSLLSAMEYHVLVLHMAGYSYDEIAKGLSISQKAVDNAVQRLRRKLMRAL